MPEGRSLCGGGNSRESVAIDTNRILDSCRDKDCYEDVKVYLSCIGQETIENAGSVRVKSADIVWTNVVVEPVQFSRGFYTVSVRFFVLVACETCSGMCRGADVYGIAVVDKKVVLFGSEGNVSIFRSIPGAGYSCGISGRPGETNLPTGVVEVAAPVVLGARIADPHEGHCCCCIAEIPENVASYTGDRLFLDDPERTLLVSLGFFSVIRIERPYQCIINGATEYTIPKKECIAAEDDDPCSLFRNMAFPSAEFSPPSLSEFSDGETGGSFGCGGSCGGGSNGGGNPGGCGCGRGK